MNQEPFANQSTSLESPASRAIAVTPDDMAVFADVGGRPLISRAVYVGGGGDIVVTTKGGDEAVFRNLPDATLLPIRISQLKTVSLGGAATTAQHILILL